MVNSKNIVWHHASVTRRHREMLNGHTSMVVWFTGLSGSGKSTLAHAVEEELYKRGCQTYVLDGDNVRHGLCSNLSFSLEDRSENIRRVAETAKLMVEAGIIILTAFISPLCQDRRQAREIFQYGDFIEIFCSAPLEICENRDVKGLYKRARAGKIQNYTGISSPYEAPLKPELIVDTANLPLETCVKQVVELLEKYDVFRSEG